ncbi:MAG: hypothetical protein R3D88_05630 [Alphaproteobacteria bacterium]|nr:hypothetical protein [Alphaproteobacteria bacterium]
MSDLDQTQKLREAFRQVDEPQGILRILAHKSVQALSAVRTAASEIQYAMGEALPFRKTFTLPDHSQPNVSTSWLETAHGTTPEMQATVAARTLEERTAHAAAQRARTEETMRGIHGVVQSRHSKNVVQLRPR